MASPAERFTPGTPPAVHAAACAAPDPSPMPGAHRRRVSREGRLNFEDERYQVGAWLAGETVELTARGELLEVTHRGVLVASLPRRLRVRPPAAPPAPRPRPETSGRSVVRMVSSNGSVSFAGTDYRVGNARRGEQVEVRLVGEVVEISKDGELLKSCPARHDRFKEHGAYSTPSGRPTRSNASPFSNCRRA